jgi:hypothetical protein
LGCSAENGSTPTPVNVGGSSGTQAGTGGAATSDGGSSNATGGAVSGTGGAKSTGGSPAETGGAKSTGGATSASTGGNKTTGGATGASTGGSKTTGGATGASTGGSKTTGGATGASTGGSKTTGGATGASTGGKATGGATGAVTGGTKATGGTSAAVGGAGTGGSTTAAGGAASFKCENLSLAPSTTGSKPAGAVGGLRVLDWAGFKGAVSFTFDDNMTTGSYSKFKATGAHVTLFVTAAMSNYAGYTGAPAAGDEIGNHTSNHSSSGSVSAFESMQATIQSSYGVTAYTGASPNGDKSWSTPAQSFFIANRGVSESDIAPRTATTNLLFDLPAYIPGTNSSASTMSSHIKSGIWKVFCIHGWTSSAYNPLSESEVISTMTKAVTDGYWAETMGHVAAYFIGQGLISNTATTTATWTLPAHFPKDMCLRVTTTGGTVTQKGAEVPWDSHGYYQISLDAGEVSVK